MKENESDLIDIFESLGPGPRSFSTLFGHRNSLLKTLEEGFDQVSEDFVEWLDKRLLPSIRPATFDKESIELWISIYKYLKNPDDKKLQIVKKEIEKYLIEDEWYQQYKMIPEYFALGKLIKNIYLSKDKKIISLLKDRFFLPEPSAEIFSEEEMPDFIRHKQYAAAETIKQTFARNRNLSIQKIEDSASLLQRSLRSLRRKKEERKICELQKRHKDFSESPYFPKCEESLAKRLVQTSKSLKLFSEIKHLTAKYTLANVIDLNRPHFPNTNKPISHTTYNR